MTMSTRFLLATGFASLMGLTLLAPAAYAQAAPAAPGASTFILPDDNGGMRPGGGPNGDRMGDHRGGRPGEGGIAGLICSTDGATLLETRLTGLATQLKLTTEQQPLYDAYRTAALSAQTAFADTCAMVQPAAGAQAAPDALTALKHRQARQVAELDAINVVLPSFEALYNSLDDTQKAALTQLAGPHPGPRGDDRGGDRAGRHDDRDDDDRDDDDRGDERGRGDKGRHDDRQGLIQPSTDITPAVNAG